MKTSCASSLHLRQVNGICCIYIVLYHLPQFTFTHSHTDGSKLPCKVMVWPSGTIWGFVSWPRTLQHADRRIKLPTLWLVENPLYFLRHSRPIEVFFVVLVEAFWTDVVEWDNRLCREGAHTPAVFINGGEMIARAGEMGLQSSHFKSVKLPFLLPFDTTTFRSFQHRCDQQAQRHHWPSGILYCGLTYILCQTQHAIKWFLIF